MTRTMTRLGAALLVVVPVALGLAATTARADVTAQTKMVDVPINVRIYGFVNAQGDAAWAKGGATPYQARGRLSDGNSRLGFFGTAEIFPKLRAIIQLEGALNFEQGGLNDHGQTTTIVSRNSFVGIEDERVGQFVLGHNESAYRALVGSASAFGGNLGLTVTGLDVWNNTSAQMSGNPWSIFGRGEERYRNSAHYMSPDWYGIRLGASYRFDELARQGGLQDRFSAAALYHFRGFTVGAGFDFQRNTGIDVDRLEQGFGMRPVAENGVSTFFYKALASYQFPTKTSIAVGVERSNYGYARFTLPSAEEPYTGLETSVMSQWGGMASIGQGIGKYVTLMASFGLLGNMSKPAFRKGSEYSAMQFSGGVKVTLSQHFATYIYYTHIKNGAQQTVNFGQAPLVTNNVGTADAFLAPGSCPRSLGIGVIARF